MNPRREIPLIPQFSIIVGFFSSLARSSDCELRRKLRAALLSGQDNAERPVLAGRRLPED